MDPLLDTFAMDEPIHSNMIDHHEMDTQSIVKVSNIKSN